jgi:uncharacterized protein YwqG
MQPTTTETFSVQFPLVYDHIFTLKESIMGEHRQDDQRLSYINISLLELNTFDDYKGDDLPARFRAFCLDERGPVEVIADKTLQVAGLNSEIRTAQAAYGYFYYFALLPINNEFGYLFIGDCESESKGYYEPLFDEIWQSLSYFEKPVEAPPAVSAIVFNGEEYWQIGDHLFKLIDKPECYISDGDGALYVRIEAQAPDQLIREENDIITGYEDGKVYLQFYFKGIYNTGIPTGKFHFENERDNSYLTYIWKGGFQYSQQLTADVTLQEGWLGINGNFNGYPVKLVVKLPVDRLEWKNYRFLSVEEVSTASPDIVHHLWLSDPAYGILQETIQPLTQLQALSIDYRTHQAPEFTEIPQALQNLSELKELSLTGVTSLKSLPQGLGNLKKLETITLHYSGVESIHPDIFQLPVLKKLYLGINLIQSIPPFFTESLEMLDLANNKLTRVPESVTRLQSLNISNNPLQQLPAGLENIPNLTLELEKKIAFLDYSYKGADGQGTVPYHDSRFFAKNDAELLPLMEAQINANGLSEFKKGLINRTRWSVALETTDEDTYSEKGNHRFGGLPDLPPGVPYPIFIDWEKQERGLQFIAQINCSAIAHLQDYLPRTGMLYFFITDQEEMGPKVLYYDGDSNSLQSAKELNIDNDFVYEQNGIYNPFRAEAGKYASIPSMYNASSLYPELAALDEMYEKTEQLTAGLVADSAKPVHGINSYVFKQHDTPEIEAAYRMKGKPEEWMVLLRVSSDNNPGFCFWDAGEIYFVIHKSDLDKKDFSNVYCGLESS